MQEKTLIQITDEIRQMVFERQRYIDEGLPVPAEVESEFQELVKFGGEKIDRCVSFIKMSENQIAWLDSEIEHLKSQKKKFENAIDSMKDIAKHIMESNGITKMEGVRGHSFRLQRSESVDVKSMNQIPEKYLRKKISLEPDKNAIKAMLKDGEQIPGVELKTNYSVVVK